MPEKAPHPLAQRGCSTEEEDPYPAVNSAATAANKIARAFCLPRTMLAKASAGSYKQCCQAQMDPGAMLSLVTVKLAHSIKAKHLRGTAVTRDWPVTS